MAVRSAEYETELRKISEYAQDKLDPVLKPLLELLLVERPDNVITFIINYLKGLEAKSESKIDEPKIQSPLPPPTNFNRWRRRTGISAEPVDVLEQKESSPIFYPKSDEDKGRIKDCIEDNILFKSLDRKQLGVILDAMKSFEFKAGDLIIKQGDEGDFFYIMDAGEAECFVAKDAKPPILVKTYSGGESFGELALMYNSPRAATIKAKSDVKCWGLDRVSFRNLLKITTGDKQRKYENFLHRVPILQSLNEVELAKIADALVERTFEDGEHVIRQGKLGDMFYIIIEGEARVFKTYEDGTEVELARLKDGQYFGELALVTDNPRAANVVALGKLVTVTLDRGAFTRLLGPLQEILKRSKKNYEEIEQKLYQEKLEQIKGLSGPVITSARKFSQRRRTGVSAESMSFHSEKEKSYPVFPKSNIQKAVLMNAITRNTLLQNLDHAQLRIVVDAMVEKSFLAGQTIIKQGAQGDNFYILTEGKAECYIESDNAPPNLVKVYEAGESFGELALMYNSPRAATILAVGSVQVFALDRQTFRRVMMDTTSKKRTKYEAFLSKVSILQSLDRNERAKIADALEPKTYEDGEMVIQQGEPGDAFYIIEEGEAIATKSFDDNSEAVEVYRFKTGDYFGELALLNDKPRAANVIASGELKCLRLDRSSFVRLMGPCDEILKRNSENYAKVEAAMRKQD